MKGKFMGKRFKYLAVISLVCFTVLMLPVVYLTFVNRASGDDYGYGTLTRMAWMGTHSLAAVVRAVFGTVVRYYYSWQGTWFDVALFSLQPEVFHDRAYVIVAVLMLFLWIGSTFYLFREILCRMLRFDRWSYLLLTICFLAVSIEFVPSTKSSIYWFNGCAHYMIPFAMCQMTAAWLIRYSVEYKKSTFVGILIFMTLLGGANYQAALFALVVACYVGISAWLLRKDKRILMLTVPVLCEVAGLVVSATAPGNKCRAGEDFGFSVSAVFMTVGKSFVCGIKDIGVYVKDRPLIFAGLLLLFVLLTAVYCTEEKVYRFRHPVLLSLMLFCLYSAMQAPAIYAGVEVSRGVLNTNYQVFLLTASGILLVAAQKTAERIGGGLARHGNIDMAVWRRIVLPGILVCAVWVLIGRGYIKTSASYVSLDYIISGQAEDYKEQMDLQTRLLENENAEDIVVPGINNIQGPLMHVPVTDDPEAWSNTVTADFYGKQSVISMDRPEWMEMYGD